LRERMVPKAAASPTAAIKTNKTCITCATPISAS
jgi:hypothetical protein